MLVNQKHYNAVLDFAVDFGERLATGETLSSGAAMSVVAASSGSTALLTIASVVISGTTVQGRFTGGTCGLQVDDYLWQTRYTIKASVVTSSGETESEIVELVVYDAIQRTS